MTAMREIRDQVLKRFTQMFENAEDEELERFQKRRNEVGDGDSVHQVDADSEH